MNNFVENVFKRFLKNILRPMTLQERRQFLRQLRTAQKKRLPYPQAIQNEYQKYLTELFSGWGNYLREHFTETSYKIWVMQANPNIALDSPANDINRILGDFSSFTETTLKNSRQELEQLSQDVFRFSQIKWKDLMRSLVGVSYITDERWWRDAQGLWVNENITLIRGFGEELRKKTGTIIYEGVRQGKRWETIAQELEKTLGVLPKNRARLIARDQTAKLNSQLAKMRQTELGIEMYIWGTATDERVRGNPAGRFPNAIPSHFDMDGVLCQWEDNSVYSEDSGKTWKRRTAVMPIAHPGEEIQCRCIALAYFEHLFEEAVKDLDEEV